MGRLTFVIEELKSLSAYYVDNEEYLKAQKINTTIKELEETICIMQMKKS